MGTSVVGQLDPQKTANLPGLRDAMAGAGTQGSTTAFNFFAAFDGTNNDRNNLALSGDPYKTNIGEMAAQAENARIPNGYYPGVGTGEDRGGTINAGVAPNAPIQASAENAYRDFVKAASDYKDSGGSIEDISVSVAAFSRGGATAIKFAQLVNERGLVDADGNVLATPGSIPITGMALLDPVGRFVDGDLSIPPNVQGQVLLVQAADENRSDFRPLDFSKDERVTTIEQSGNHVGIGGGYDQGGTAANVLEGVTGYFQNRGVAIADVPAEQRFNPEVQPTVYTEAYQTAANGDVLTNENGSKLLAWPVEDSAQGRQLDSPHHPEAQTEEQLAANSAALIGILGSMAHWTDITDVQRAASFSALYNTVDHMNNGELSGDLGGAASALSFVSALQHGNAGSVVVSGVSLANALGEDFASKEIASAIGVSGAAANVVPGLSLALAIDSGNSMSMVAAAANFIPVYGPLISVGISLLGGSLFGDDDPPMPEGLMHFSWDANGNIQQTIDINQSGGGAAANSVAASVLTMLQSLVDAHNAQNASTAFDISINPYLLPKFGFSEKSAWMEVTSPDGLSMREGISETEFAQRLLEMLQDNGALGPAWLVQTQYMHYQQALQEGQNPSDAQAVLSMGAGGHAYVGNEAFSLQGNAVESADFKSQSFGSLVVHLNDDALVQAAQTRLGHVVRDVEGDGYFEQAQSVATQDSAGNLQAVLTLDFNGDGVIETRDILSLGGNTNTDNPTDEAQLAQANADQQRNNVAWLDADRDGQLTSHDPAFAAIKLWIDINQDGVQQSNEASGLLSQHISSINFKTGEVTYEDGHTDALTAQTLQADTEGVKFTQINEVNPDSTLHTLDAGTVLEHEGYQGKVQITDGGGSRWASVRNQTYEQQAKRTGDWEGTAEQDAHRHGEGNVDGAPTQTTATGASDFGSVKNQANQTTQSTITQGSRRVVSDAPVQAPRPTDTRVVFIPTAPTLVQSQIQVVTNSMIESAQSNLFGAGANAGMGVLAAVALGAVQNVQAVEQRPALAMDGLVASPLIPAHAAGSSTNTFSTTRSTDSTRVSTYAFTFRPVESGTLHTLPITPPVSETITPIAETLSTHFVYATVNLNTPAQGALASAPVSSVTSSSFSINSDALTTPSLRYPVVQGELLGGTEDVVLRMTQAVLLANDSTPDASADPTASELIITAVSAPTHGQVSLVNGEVWFVPEANFHGTASFTYRVTDQYGLSTSASATLQVAAVNDMPVTQSESMQSNEDMGVIFTQAQLLANDSDADVATDGQVLSISEVGQAQHGTVWLDAQGNVRFVSDANFNGSASFTYQVSDGNGGVIPASVNLTLIPVNDMPVAIGETISENEDTTLVISPAALLQNDSDVDVATDGQVLSITAVSNVQHGTVTLNSNGTISFVPEADFYGNASFDYTVDDGHGGTATTTAVIALANVNDAPVATGETVNSNEDEVLTFTASALLQNDGDIDNAHANLTISRVQSGTGGTVSLNASGDVVFTPTLDYNGTATFTYWVKDPDGLESNAVNTRVVLAAMNDAPSAQGEVVTGATEDAVFNINASTLLTNDHDIDDPDSALSLSWVGNAMGGSVSLDASGNVVFTPTTNFNGNATFQYKVRDAAGLDSALVQAVIPVTAVNDNPVAVDDQFTTYANSTMTIGFNQLTSNDPDVDHDALKVSAVRDKANGHASIVDGQVQFDPNTDFKGSASFDYLTDDGQGGQTWATAFVDVREPPNLYASVSILGTSVRPWGLFATIGYTVTVSFQISDDDDPSAAQMSLISISTAGGGYTGYSLSRTPSGGTFTFQHVDVCGMTWRITDSRGLVNDWHYYFERYNFEGTSYASRGYSDYSGYYYPPVILDLNGDGMHYTSLVDSKVAFDVNFDGLADSMAWAGNDDGVLVWDKDQNHQITDASEFGFQTLKAHAQTDLEGLQALDTNGNGLLDAQDAKFAEFAVWQDANGNGVNDAGEFKTLTELGIANINLHSDGQMCDAGTLLANSGSGETDATVMGNAAFTHINGSTGVVADTVLAYEAGHATPTSTHPQTVDTSATDAQTAEIIRQALLFNQVCNTAVTVDSAPLGFVPIQPDVQLHDMLVTPQDGSHQLMHSA